MSLTGNRLKNAYRKTRPPVPKNRGLFQPAELSESGVFVRGRVVARNDFEKLFRIDRTFFVCWGEGKRVSYNSAAASLFEPPSSLHFVAAIFRSAGIEGGLPIFFGSRGS